MKTVRFFRTSMVFSLSLFRNNLNAILFLLLIVREKGL